MHQLFVQVVLHKRGTLFSQLNSVTTTQIEGSIIYHTASSGYGARSELHFLLSETKQNFSNFDCESKTLVLFFSIFIKMKYLFTRKKHAKINPSSF